MKIVKEILIFLFAGFLDLIRADEFPLDLRQFNIRLELERGSVLQSPIDYRDNLQPRRPFWMRDGPGGEQQEPGVYFAYIETPKHVYGSVTELEGTLGPDFRSDIHQPTKAYLRLQGLENFTATDFQLYFPGNVLQKPLDVGKYGRLYLAYPRGPYFTALLQPDKTYIRYRSPKRQPSCCSFFPGGRR